MHIILRATVDKYCNDRITVRLNSPGLPPLPAWEILVIQFPSAQVVGGYQATVILRCLDGDWKDAAFVGEVCRTQAAHWFCDTLLVCCRCSLPMSLESGRAMQPPVVGHVITTCTMYNIITQNFDLTFFSLESLILCLPSEFATRAMILTCLNCSCDIPAQNAAEHSAAAVAVAELRKDDRLMARQLGCSVAART